MGDDNKEDASLGAAAEFKFNVHAPEFVPRSVAQMPIPGYYYPYIHLLGGSSDVASDWLCFADHEEVHFVPDSLAQTPGHSKNANDVTQKIVKQVEYQFSDANLIASDFLLKIMNKDADGYVPMSVIASWKKIKSLGVSNQTIIKALKTSPKLVLSEDGKKVRRKKLFTERDKEELMSRTVIVENLPEDTSRQNIEKIFSTAGSIKNVRICHPQESNSARSSKTDVLIGNKLHAFVEFENSDQADKAVEKLNDERNWRKGLRVRLMLRRSPRSVIRGKRSDYDHFDMQSEDDQSPPRNLVSSPKIDQVIEHKIDDSLNAAKKAWGRGRAKPHGHLQNYNGRGVLSQAPQGGQTLRLGSTENYSKPSSPGPRMPDGTRGFAIGRGKPLVSAMDLAPIKL